MPFTFAPDSSHARLRVAGDVSPAPSSRWTRRSHPLAVMGVMIAYQAPMPYPHVITVHLSLCCNDYLTARQRMPLCARPFGSLSSSRIAVMSCSSAAAGSAPA